MITNLTAITPEYMKHRIEEETEEYKQEIERLKSIIEEVREKVKGVKKINNKVYKQTDMLERFYSRKWCNDEMDSFLEILDKENNSEQKNKEPVIS